LYLPQLDTPNNKQRARRILRILQALTNNYNIADNMYKENCSTCSTNTCGSILNKPPQTSQYAVKTKFASHLQLDLIEKDLADLENITPRAPKTTGRLVSSRTKNITPPPSPTKQNSPCKIKFSNNNPYLRKSDSSFIGNETPVMIPTSSNKKPRTKKSAICVAIPQKSNRRL
jgi:hypothetical protein